MSSSTNKFLGSAVAALTLMSAVAALLMIVAEMPIDLLMNLLALVLLSLTTIGALGWFVLRRPSALSPWGVAFEGDPAPGEPRQLQPRRCDVASGQFRLRFAALKNGTPRVDQRLVNRPERK